MREITLDSTLELQRRCRDILELGVTSFPDLALVAPDLWRTFVNPQERLAIAETLGWPTQCRVGALEQMALAEYLAVFLNSGVASAEDLWFFHPEACEFLRRNGGLEAVLQLLRLPEPVYPDDPAYYIRRCRLAGCFEAWRDVEGKAFRIAAGLGLLEQIARQVPHRPVGGYPTAGGPVRSTAQLIVARLLEFGGVTFRADMVYTASRRRPGLSRYFIDILLTDPETGIIIAGEPGRGAGFGDRKRARWLRRCGWGAQVLELRGDLLQEWGFAAFFVHTRVRLGEAGIVATNLFINPLRCLEPEALGQPAGDDGGSR